MSPTGKKCNRQEKQSAKAKVQRPHMRSCFVKWKGTSSHGKTQNVLTGYGAPMPRSISVATNRVGQNQGRMVNKNFQQGLCSHSKEHDTNDR